MMEKTARIGTALVTAMLLSVAPACANAAEEVPSTVGITVGTLGNPFFKPLIEGAKAAVLQANPKAKITAVGADYDLGKQSTQIDNFIANGSDLIMLNSVDAQATAPAVARAKAAGIVVGRRRSHARRPPESSSAPSTFLRSALT